MLTYQLTAYLHIIVVLLNDSRFIVVMLHVSLLLTGSPYCLLNYYVAAS